MRRVGKAFFKGFRQKSEVVRICSSTRGGSEKNGMVMSQCSCTCTCGKVASCNWDSQVVYHIKMFLENPAEK